MKQKTNKIIKLVLLLFVAVFMLGSFSGQTSAASKKKCLKNDKVTLKIKKKNVTKKTYSLKKGNMAALKVSVRNLKGKKGENPPKIKYSSSNKKVAAVNAKGVVKAKKTGTAKIKVTVTSQKKKITAWTKIKVIKETSSKPKQPSNDNSDSNTSDSNTPDNNTSDNSVPDNNNNSSDNSEPNGDRRQKNILVVYFSCTGTTKPLAEYAAEYLNADLYEIEPETPYTSDDLNYGNSNSRATKEQNDSSARPAISGNVENMAQYDTVVLAYPKMEYGISLCI